MFILIAILGYSYYAQKNTQKFNALEYKMQTSSGVITLNELRKNHKAIFIYFGFLSCPEACPTTLGTMANVLNSLSEKQKDQVAFVFVDLDPDRDKLEDIKNYTEYFHKKIIPISIPANELDQFTEKFGIVYMKMNIESKLSYTIDHSTQVVVLDQNGKLLTHIDHGSPKVVFLDRINKILAGKEASL